MDMFLRYKRFKNSIEKLDILNDRNNTLITL